MGGHESSPICDRVLGEPLKCWVTDGLGRAGFNEVNCERLIRQNAIISEPKRRDFFFSNSGLWNRLLRSGFPNSPFQLPWINFAARLIHLRA